MTKENSPDKPVDSEFELVILDTLESDTFKSINQISKETGLDKELVQDILSYMSEDMSIIKKGSLYRWSNDSDEAEDLDD